MQIYKIYINEKELILLRSEDVANHPYPRKSTLVLRYTSKNKVLFQAIDTLEKNGPYERVILHALDYKQLKKDLKSLFITIKAGGGLVINESGEGLYIFRRGHWDLPKGKLDPGESWKVAAKREVIEETGVNALKLGRALLKTRHVYRTSNGKRVLKLTKWYLMHAPKQDLIPEEKEQIEQAVWLDLNFFLNHSRPTFRSVTDVTTTYLSGEKEA